MSVSSSTITAVTCLGCGCACDDITISIHDGRITEARQACTLGIAWFGDGRTSSRTTVAGQDASRADAVAAAARLLADASRPLVYLAADLSCEAQREAVALADLTRAACDSLSSATSLDHLLAAQEQGRATATLGEIRHRADVIVYWGVDPGERYPRFATRYAEQTTGRHLPGGRRSRTVIAVDVGANRGPQDADTRVAVSPADEVSLLRLAIAHLGIGQAPPPGSSLAATANEMIALVARGKYVALVVDGEAASAGQATGIARASALVELSQALNGPVRGALAVLRGGGNRPGADAVMTSQTGFPVAVDFSRGYPRYRPHDGHAARLLARREVDAALILGSLDAVPDDVRAALTGVRHAIVGPRATTVQNPRTAAAIDAGVAGIHEAGTALRTDDVPLPLKRLADGPAGVGETLRELQAALRPARHGKAEAV